MQDNSNIIALSMQLSPGASFVIDFIPRQDHFLLGGPLGYFCAWGRGMGQSEAPGREGVGLFSLKSQQGILRGIWKGG